MKSTTAAKETTMTQQTMWSGTRAVAMYANTPDGPWTSCLWVNCDPDVFQRSGHLTGDITLMRAKAQTLKGAKKQAARMLSLDV
jgi:hypothetical protein